MNKKSNTFFIVLISIFISLTLISSIISSFIKLPFLGGNSIEFSLLFYIFSIILIKKNYFKLFYFFSLPLLLLITPGLFFINPIQVIIEYLLSYYVFFPILFFNKMTKEKTKIQKTIIFLVLVFFSICLKLICHLVAGYFWWTNGNIYLSFVLNVQYVFGSFAIILPFLFLMFPTINNLYENSY